MTRKQASSLQLPVHRARLAAVAVALAALLACLGLYTAHAAHAATTGQITGYQGLCMDDRGASTANFNPVQVYTCDGSTAQQWTVGSGNTLQVLGMCLDVDGAGTANGTTVDIYTCNGTGAQVWEPQSDGALLNPESNACLDDTGSGGSGTQLQIWSCAGSSNQVWTLPTASSTTSCSTTDAALNQPTTASSTENSSFPASDATDGNTGTRWSSAFSDPQWLEVDLGSTQSVCGVSLNWETAYATAFQIQVSNDNSTWTSLYSTTTGTGGVQTPTVSGSGRYIRVYGTARATQYGYSLWEFDVYTLTGGTTSSPTPTPTPTGTGSSGTGEPPSSFWGNTSAIPATPSGDTVEVAIVNQTNGQYPDSEVYWSFNGQEESIAQQPYIAMPPNSAGRMYFYLGSPDSQYYDFIEFTAGATSINLDTTRVDRFGLKLAVDVHSSSGGTDQEIGENYATFQESRTATFQRFEDFVPSQFKELATDQAPYGIPSPGNDAAFQTGGAYANYFSSALSAVGDTSDNTPDVFGCGGTLSGNPTLCAALNRGVSQLSSSDQANPANFYQTAPANYYAEFWHENAINGVQYGFPYDDVDGQSSDIAVTNPQYMVVAVGW